MIGINQIKSSYGSETALIILCCRISLKTGTLYELETFVLTNSINWERVAYLAGIHKVRPIVYKAVLNVQIPADVKLRLTADNAELIRLNWKQSIETERLIVLLKQNDIEAVPYKGTAFSKQFYHDFVSRESNDIDLIIDAADLTKAIKVLNDDGYMPEIEDVYQYLGSRYFDYYKDFSLNKFKKHIRDHHLELHWAIAENYYYVNSKVNSFMYTHGEQFIFVKSIINTLDPVAHFSAVLIHHAIKDSFTSIKNVIDISFATQHPHIQAQIPLLESTFTSLDLHNVLNMGVGLSQQLMGVGLNQLPNAKIKRSTMQHFIRNVCSGHLLLTDKKLWGSINNALLLQDSGLKKLHFLFHLITHRFVPATTDFRTFTFPKSLFFLYYLLKPFRSLIKRFNPDEEKRKLISKS
jgi:hypothetical protein